MRDARSNAKGKSQNEKLWYSPKANGLACPPRADTFVLHFSFYTLRFSEHHTQCDANDILTFGTTLKPRSSLAHILLVSELLRFL